MQRNIPGIVEKWCSGETCQPGEGLEEGGIDQTQRVEFTG